MKNIFAAMLLVMASGCTEEPHLKYNLSYDRTADECSSGIWNYKLTSNTNGERFEFNQCLPQEYKGEFTVIRRADTLVVSFPPDTARIPGALYKMVLDVDAWPKYSHIYLGSQLLQVSKKQ